MHRAWRGEPVAGAGKAVSPRPVRGDALPILIGGDPAVAAPRVVRCRTRATVPATFATATRPARTPAPPATSMAFAVGKTATAAGQIQLELDGSRYTKRRSIGLRPAVETAAWPVARPSMKCSGSAAHSLATETRRKTGNGRSCASATR